jgi:uncharacterized membrane protein
VSWEVTSYLIMAGVLAGGFVWYERSRPSARMVALVAALAALAVAGRLVFAPIPNVQATTDIVLFTGFALGAAPGFAVGALGALISNMWLGQGPWTPWEMAGWGLVGLAGAGLGTLTSRRLGRLGLAAAAALAGLAYGALLDFSVMATAGGELSLDRYLAIAARGIPFNIAHALGNALLALAAGPALVRMIVRYRERSEFTWRPELAAPVALIAVAVAFALPAPPPAQAGSSAVGWLSAARNSDGGFGVSPGSSSSAAMTGWAMLGLEGAGRNPLDLGPSGRTPVDYLRAHVDGLQSTGDLERTILALEGAGVNPQSFGGHNLTADLLSRRGKDGSFQDQVNLTAFGILALRAAGAPRSKLAASEAWLAKAQGDDGGWGFQPGISSDADSTGAALQGIAAGGGGGKVLKRGVGFLRSKETSDGAWPLGGNGVSNSQSTAWAIQGLVAAGVPPRSVSSHGHSGLDFLAARHDSDGHYRYSSSSDQTPVWVTGQALLATEQKAFPLAAVPRSTPAHHAHRRGGSNSSHHSHGGSANDAHHTSTGGSAAGTSGASHPAGGGDSNAPAREHRGGSHPASGGSSGSNPAGDGGGETTTTPRRLFADTDVSAPPAAQTSTPAQAATGSSHTARNIAAAAIAATLAAAGLWWWRRRRA